ncbi:undecaprenyldiphospho-muramoylpentapeptide beta-N-acetylglucosaminyltransferase [soil metagenome]
MVRQSTTQPQGPPVRIILTGGGTGGHVSPILAVIDELRSRKVQFNALWIGSRHGTERLAAEEHSIPYRAISVGKLRRYVSLRTIPDTARVPIGLAQCIPVIRRFRADVVFSTGGYVGVPAVIAGRLLHVPSLTHEQTAVLGLATRINARFSRCVALSHDQTPRPRVGRGGRVVVTGNPIRAWLKFGEASRARRHFNLVSDLPLLYVTGGAQGALAINDAIGAALPEILEAVEIVHQTGPNEYNGSFETLTRLRSELPACLRDRYHLTERVGPELSDLYAAAEIVLGRSGAGTVAELAALGKPSVLIPLPGVIEQLENARILESAGASIVVEQTNLTADRLIETIRKLASEPETRLQMSKSALHSAGTGDPARRLVDELLRLVQETSLSGC